jgi:hypothetical protein
VIMFSHRRNIAKETGGVYRKRQRGWVTSKSQTMSDGTQRGGKEESSRQS